MNDHIKTSVNAYVYYISNTLRKNYEIKGVRTESHQTEREIPKHYNLHFNFKLLNMKDIADIKTFSLYKKTAKS